MKGTGITAIVIIAVALFGALAFTVYRSTAGVEFILKTVVDQGERIVPGMAVEVDGLPAGTVRSVKDESGILVASLAIDNQVCRNVLRDGTVRIPSGQSVYLRTLDVQPGAAKLKSGDIVRVRGSSKIADFIPKISLNGRRLAAIGLIALFVILAVWRVCRSLLPLGLSLVLALLVGWLLHPFVVPLVDKYLPEVTARVDAMAADAPAGGFGALQAKLSEMLSARPNSSIVSFVLTTLVSLPFCALLISSVGSIARRGISCAFIGGCLLASLSTAMPASAADVSYSLKHLRLEQREASTVVEDAASLCDNADRLLGASLVREASEKVTESLFVLDSVDVNLAGYDDRIQALRGSLLGYARSDEQRKLTAGKTKLDERIRDVRNTASDIQKRASKVNSKEANIIQVYLVLADAYRLRIRNGLSEWAVVLNECRQLSGFPLALVRSGVVNADNVARCRIGDDESVVLPNGAAIMPDGSPKHTEAQVKLSALEIEAERLRRELDEVRKAQTQTVSSVASLVPLANSPASKPRKPVEKSAIRKLESRIPAVPTAPSTAEALTNPPRTVATVPAAIITSPVQVESVKKGKIPFRVETSDRATAVAVEVAPPIVADAKSEQHAAETSQVVVAVADAPSPVPETRVAGATNSKLPAYPTATPGVKDAETSGADRQMIPIAIVAGLLVLGIIGLALGINRSGQSHEVTIAAQPMGGPFAEHKLVSSRGEQIILGDGEPRVESAGLNLPVPATISINARGRAEIMPGTATVLLNGESIGGKTAIHPGSSIQIKRNSGDEGDDEIYTLRLVDTVDAVELQDVEGSELEAITEEK